MGRYSYHEWRPYVSVAERRRRAAKKIAKMQKAGREVSPVEIAGRKITATFWGDAWCTNLEAYSDYANRLPRGRTYVRNGSVIDLQIEDGRVSSLVSGSDIYEVVIKIKPLAKKRWADIKGQCAGQIDSLVELLRGSISKGVMEIVTRKGEGLFPSPREITLSCSCPDWATMCKHVAATLYSVGARLDHEPEMLFTLRGVDPTEMVEAAVAQPSTTGKPRKGRVLASSDLSSVFGVDINIAEASSEDSSAPSKPARRARRTAQIRKKATSKKNKKTNAKPAAKKMATKESANETTVRKEAAKRRGAKKSTPKRATTKKTATKKIVEERLASVNGQFESLQGSLGKTGARGPGRPKGTVKKQKVKRTKKRIAQPPLSSVIVEILETRKKPLKVSEIHDALLNEKKYKTRAKNFKANVRIMLYKNEKELFKKVGPGAFTLAKAKSK
jgi:uncharacterized Zn finger protein